MYFFLMLSALNDDERSFIENLYIKYGKYMYYIAYKRTGNEHDAKDVVNDSMVKIIKYVTKFYESPEDKICSMVATVVNQRAVDLLNKKKRHSENQADIYYKDEDTGTFVMADIADSEPTPEDLVIKAEEIQLVQKAVRNVSSDMKAALKMKFVFEFSSDEAADFLGISNNTYRSRLFKAKNKIRNILEKEMGKR